MEKLYKKRILFIGMPDFGAMALERLVNENFNIVGVIVPHKSDPSYNYMKSCALNLNMNVIDYENSLKENEFLNKLSDLDMKNLHTKITILFNSLDMISNNIKEFNCIKNIKFNNTQN